MEFKWSNGRINRTSYILKVLSYWNLNGVKYLVGEKENILKVLSYWNLNILDDMISYDKGLLKVLSYWNLNMRDFNWDFIDDSDLKYYHIGI